jgi:hypothetical protein
MVCADGSTLAGVTYPSETRRVNISKGVMTAIASFPPLYRQRATKTYIFKRGRINPPCSGASYAPTVSSRRGPSSVDGVLGGRATTSAQRTQSARSIALSDRSRS